MSQMHYKTKCHFISCNTLLNLVYILYNLKTIVKNKEPISANLSMIINFQMHQQIYKIQFHFNTAYS